MEVVLASLASELTKIAEDSSKKQGPSYPARVVAGLPIVTAQALSDIPEGIIEKSVEHSIREGRPRLVSEAGFRRFATRIGAGALTTPMFVSGMQDIADGKTKADQKKGFAKVVGAGGVYALSRGALDSKFDPALKHLSTSEKIRRVVGLRTAMGLGAAALTAASVGKHLRGRAQQETISEKYLKPAAVGAALAGGKGALDEFMEHGTKTFGTRSGLKSIAARSIGKATAGAAATLFLSELMKKVLPKKVHEKRAEAAQVGLTPSVMNQQTVQWAKTADSQALGALYADIQTRGGERSPANRAVLYAIHDELTARGEKLPPLKTREKVVPTVSQGLVDMTLVGAVAATPAVAWRAINALPTSDRDRVLSAALDRIALEKKLTVVFDAAKGDESHFGGTLSLAHDSDPAVRAHEMGHATAGPVRSMIAENVQELGRVGMMMSIILPVTVVSGLGDASFSTKEDLQARAKVLEQVGTLTAAMQVPRLAEEALASVHGMRHLSAAGASAGEVATKALTHMAPAFASYAAPMAVPFVGAQLLKRRANAKKTQ